ncbi:carbohydrate ABC transporter permease [Herbiconiux sp. VKM Ac-1786]|jgi:multiple sugar transport system permease protein|uniref:carbohydrate ABC transporter permease n=1 Tax=Herbiconiux sp. VKM Ac-1786 TaxID=2783824 RepID=UPI00188B7564|nr:carbohydrate ABC transporter permease [Herbiconiux sp. VKM Ac-1786]MBF4572692.1 carbohydrate ABC transporter permease [Herbiconiux sp. VKM Ac-1786]
MSATLSAPARKPDASGEPGASRSNRKPRAPREKLMSRSAAMIVMVVSCFYFLLPVWWLFVSSTKSREQFGSTNGFLLADFNLFQNIGNLFAYNDGIYLRWMLNSVLYAGAGALIGTVISAMAGYALAKYRFPGRELVFNVVLGGVLVPATALALPLFLIFSQVGATNTFWSVFLPSLVNPFGVYLARIYASASVPDELLEASRLDGSGEVRTFFTIARKLMTPALVTIFLFQFVAIWNNFFLPLIMLRDESLFPVTLGLYTWNSQVNQIPEIRTYVIIGAFVSIIPLIIAFLSLQRFWQSGLGSGSVK